MTWPRPCAGLQPRSPHRPDDEGDDLPLRDAQLGGGAHHAGRQAQDDADPPGGAAGARQQGHVDVEAGDGRHPQVRHRGAVHRLDGGRRGGGRRGDEDCVRRLGGGAAARPDAAGPGGEADRDERLPEQLQGGNVQREGGRTGGWRGGEGRAGEGREGRGEEG